MKTKDLIESEKERLEWSLKTFTEATSYSSLLKCDDELNEIAQDLALGKRRPEEYADALMCLFDSAGRQKDPITLEEIIDAFIKKVKINKGRTWVKNKNNTYSHIK